MRKIKVAILSPGLEPRDGWGRYTHSLCNILNQFLEITLYLPRNISIQGKYPFPILPLLPPFTHSLKGEDSRLYLSPDFKVEADIIHSFIAFPYAILAKNLAQDRIPYLITAHGSYGVKPLLSPPDSLYLREAYRKAYRIIVPSNFTGKFIQRYSRIPLKIETIPNGVDYERFSSRKEEINSLRELYRGKKVILNVGELKPRKGQDILIKAFLRVKKKLREAVLCLIGKDAWGGYLRSLVRRLGLEKSVYFLGELEEEEMIKYYQVADIFVHVPRRIKWKFEGFGIVYLEAGACGKPVVGSRSGGVPDAVLDGVTGILVPENSPRATAKAILKILNNPQLAYNLGEKGRKRAGELRWENYARKLMEIYQKAGI